MYLVYNKKTNKCRAVSAVCKEYITLEKDETVSDIVVETPTSDDIRAYNSDGSVKTIKEQVDLGIIELKENEIIKEDENRQWIETLNKNIPEDRIELIERGLDELLPNEKINKKKDSILHKTKDELYNDGIIGDEEYNIYIKEERENFSFIINNEIIKLIFNYLLENKSNLGKLEKDLERIIEMQSVVKENLPLTTDNNFRAKFTEKMKLIQESENEDTFEYQNQIANVLNELKEGGIE